MTAIGARQRGLYFQGDIEGGRLMGIDEGLASNINREVGRVFWWRDYRRYKRLAHQVKMIEMTEEASDLEGEERTREAENSTGESYLLNSQIF